MANKKRNRMQWYRMDLHIHTPASVDYKNKDADYVDILRRAEQRGIDIMAFTDHNTVNGYAVMMEDINRLQFLEQSGRAQADELRLLAEYRRLLDKVLVLPGFEFTATFGFHILGIFPPETPIRYIEHILLSLNVPPAVLGTGDAAAGAGADRACLVDPGARARAGARRLCRIEIRAGGPYDGTTHGACGKRRPCFAD